KSSTTRATEIHSVEQPRHSNSLDIGRLSRDSPCASVEAVDELDGGSPRVSFGRRQLGLDSRIVQNRIYGLESIPATGVCPASKRFVTRYFGLTLLSPPGVPGGGMAN